MPLYLASNLASMNAQHNLNRVSASLNTSLERLSTGSKINRASDAPGSLLVSENFRSQIRGADVAMTNVQQGLSMMQTADGALQQITDHLQKLRDIALSAGNSTTTTAQYAAYSADAAAELAAINNIANKTTFNGKNLLDGSNAAANSIVLQVGANTTDTMDVSAALADNKGATLGISNTTLSNITTAGTLLSDVDTALKNVATNLSKIGQFENQLTDQSNFLSIAKENYTAAESSIRNTDVASESANVARLQILQQAAAYSLSQANTMPSIAMKLLQ